MSAALIVLSLAITEVRFTGPEAADRMCACLLEARQTAEGQGRIDFSVEVTMPAGDDLRARIWMGPARSVGRIHFTGHTGVNDSTLRRAMTLNERDLFDVTQLRRSLARINALALFEPVSLADIQIADRADGVGADLTIPLRERKRRWWSVSGPLIPGFGWLQASVSSRLPPWGRGIFDASTYFVTFNVIGFVPAIVRPIIPGQEWLSGFVISPKLSPRKMLAGYAATHLANGVGALLEPEPIAPLAIPIVNAATKTLVCHPPKARLWWLRRALAGIVNAVY